MEWLIIEILILKNEKVTLQTLVVNTIDGLELIVVVITANAGRIRSLILESIEGLVDQFADA